MTCHIFSPANHSWEGRCRCRSLRTNNVPLTRYNETAKRAVRQALFAEHLNSFFVYVSIAFGRRARSHPERNKARSKLTTQQCLVNRLRQMQSYFKCILRTSTRCVPQLRSVMVSPCKCLKPGFTVIRRYRQ